MIRGIFKGATLFFCLKNYFNEKPRDFLSAGPMFETPVLFGQSFPPFPSPGPGRNAFRKKKRQNFLKIEKIGVLSVIISLNAQKSLYLRLILLLL